MGESDEPTPENAAKDYTRELGVVESFVAITRECPSGPVRAMAERALEAVKHDKDSIREQVYYVLTALQGWRGERASQVHASLTAFYERSRSAEASGEAPRDE